MNTNCIVHFGAGALGRGLVVPMLVESDKQVILVDTNPPLIKQIKKQNGYLLNIADCTDESQFIEIVDIVSSVQEEDKLLSYLQNATTVTTAVKRENLVYVAATLAKAWKDTSNEGRQVLCCENIEHVGSLFKSLLLEQCATKAEKENIAKIKVPDTIVDRICAVDKDLTVTSEQFYELSVDRKVIADSGIKKITSVDNIEGHFYRKRYLLNSYADAISFLALSKGKTYLYEAAADVEINQAVIAYIKLLKTLLHAKYHIDKNELDEWYKKYKQRLSNDKIPRKLETVARNLEMKLGLEERFVSPILELQKMGYDYHDGITFIRLLLHADALTRVKQLWTTDYQGAKLYDEFEKTF